MEREFNRQMKIIHDKAFAAGVHNYGVETGTLVDEKGVKSSEILADIYKTMRNASHVLLKKTSSNKTAGESQEIRDEKRRKLDEPPDRRVHHHQPRQPLLSKTKQPAHTWNHYAHDDDPKTLDMSQGYLHHQQDYNDEEEEEELPSGDYTSRGMCIFNVKADLSQDFSVDDMDVDGAEHEEMDMNPDLIDFLAKSAQFRKERDAAKKDNKYVNLSLVDQHSNKEKTCAAPTLTSDKKQRKHAMDNLYGEHTGEITSLETALSMKYDRAEASRSADTVLWPHLPINIKF